MARNLSNNEVNETGVNKPQFQTEEELMHSMGYKQVRRADHFILICCLIFYYFLLN